MKHPILSSYVLYWIVTLTFLLPFLVRVASSVTFWGVGIRLQNHMPRTALFRYCSSIIMDNWVNYNRNENTNPWVISSKKFIGMLIGIPSSSIPTHRYWLTGSLSWIIQQWSPPNFCWLVLSYSWPKVHSYLIPDIWPFFSLPPTAVLSLSWADRAYSYQHYASYHFISELLKLFGFMSKN